MSSHFEKGALISELTEQFSITETARRKAQAVIQLLWESYRKDGSEKAEDRALINFLTEEQQKTETQITEFLRRAEDRRRDRGSAG